jgi:hypothetical protein
MNKRLAASSFCREASLPGDAKEFLRKVGLCSTRQRITAARLPLRTPLGTSLLKSSTKERVKHVAPFPRPPFATRCANLSKPD